MKRIKAYSLLDDDILIDKFDFISFYSSTRNMGIKVLII